MWKLPSGNFIPGRFSTVKRFKRFVREFFTTRRGLAVVPRLSGASWLGAAVRLGDGVAAERLEGGGVAAERLHRECSRNAPFDEIVWIRPTHWIPIRVSACKTPGQRLAVVSFGKEGPSHPYYFVVSCIFLAQMHEIAWIAGRRIVLGSEGATSGCFRARKCDVGLFWGPRVRRRAASGYGIRKRNAGLPHRSEARRCASWASEGEPLCSARAA